MPGEKIGASGFEASDNKRKQMRDSNTRGGKDRFLPQGRREKL